MDTNQKMKIDHILETQVELKNAWLDYWQSYSSFGTWQFWVSISLLIIPLIALYVFMDKKRAILLGFYGYNVHAWSIYIDDFSVYHDLWFYPYKFLPILPMSVALDASLIPVLYILMYQFTSNNKKNYYLYLLGLSMGMAFVYKPIMEALGLFQLHRGTTPIHLFIAYLTVGLIAKVITNLFLFFVKTYKEK
ncbi:CBO0543 family protein [Priestia megaterium]|uniref:CBO0543 family protein n=1 Tax=Priestia megaterium TaxID=1404 RepID=UPI000BA6D1D3|nr:CBO0543 family protein [Priestia megaterium]PAK42759.1 hypothetical protein CHH47_28410 [Priestia megaterium]